MTSPINYYYNYKGNTTGNAFSKAVIYHIANPNMTTDASMSAFSAMFDLNGLTASSKVIAQTQFSVDFIDNSALLTPFDPLTAIASSSNIFNPTFTLSIKGYTALSKKI